MALTSDLGAASGDLLDNRHAYLSRNVSKGTCTG